VRDVQAFELSAQLHLQAISDLHELLVHTICVAMTNFHVDNWVAFVDAVH
jgi:hypothetical protein